MSSQEDYGWPDEEAALPECIECGAEATVEMWADEGGHSVWLCDECAYPACFSCGKQIQGRPITGWHSGLGEMVKLCTECSQKGIEGIEA